MKLVACMGGWCVQRTHCAHYYSESKMLSERLCPKGDAQPVEIKGKEYGVQVTAPSKSNGVAEVAS